MPEDFDGCHRTCRVKGVHSLIWGGCEHAVPPEPTVSMSMICADAGDGYPSIGFDSYTVAQLAELIEPALHTIKIRLGPNARGMLERGEEVRLTAGEYVSLALAAADAIVHRNTPGQALREPASCSPAAPETEPNNSRTTPDNPATSEWTPPPPGDRREQLPDDILAAIRPGPYLSTACHAAFLCETTEPTDTLAPWPRRLHARCRLQNKFTGKPCVCSCHGPDDLTGAWTPDPPIGCLNLTAPKEQQR